MLILYIATGAFIIGGAFILAADMTVQTQRGRRY